MNNLKNIREIYGITQDEIAKAINVNRATISNWENQEDRKASNSSLEKLSLFYGIGPEFFYEEELNDTVRQMLVNNAKRQKEIEKDSNREHAKAEDLLLIFYTYCFPPALRIYYLVSGFSFTALLTFNTITRGKCGVSGGNSQGF